MALSEYSKRLLGAYAEQPFLMAPMAGVTDPAYRIMCRRRGANLAYSEMVSVAGLAYASNKSGAWCCRLSRSSRFACSSLVLSPISLRVPSLPSRNAWAIVCRSSISIWPVRLARS